MNLPKQFEDRMKELLGEEYKEYLQCYTNPHYSGLRVNTMKTTPEVFERFCPYSIDRVPWVNNGYYYDSEQQPAKHPFYYAGLYYIQEPSAMTPASLLPIRKGDKVLDICAAPGGKSTELGAKLDGEGLLVSNDISNSRAKALLKNIELFGIRNALVVSEAPNKLLDYFPEYFDKILIDAPCSGEGMFRKSSSIIKNWEEHGVAYYSELQKEIILSVAKMLKPGGYMLYSTCTFSPEENEGTISYLLENYPDFEVVNAIPDEETQKELGLSYEGFDFGKPEWVNGKEELKHCLRLWPHKIKGEGHFITLLHKKIQTIEPELDLPMTEYRVSNSGNSLKGKKLLSEEANEFLGQLKFQIKEELLEVHEERVYLLPEGLPNVKGLRILRKGLLLGEMKKQRFEPAQALANAINITDYDKVIKLNLEDPNVIRYLKCESILLEGEYADGWYLICVENFPLGWVKITKNNLKNKYQPGWRWV
jgi:NOL1/NOP2/sun family putative RNA methylase